MMTGSLINKINLALSENKINFGKLSYSAIYGNPQNRGRITMAIYENSRRTPIYVAKIPRTNAGRQALEREQKCLQRCIETNKFLKDRIYRIYWSDEDISFIIERYFKGYRISNLKGVKKVSLKILDWIIQLQKNSSGPTWNKRDIVTFSQSLIAQVNSYYKISPQINHLLNELETRISNMKDFEMQATVVHGDLMIKNILINGDDIEVFDWEWVQEYGWPLIDTWFFLFSASGLCKPSSNYMERGVIVAKTLIGLTQFSKHIKNLIAYYNDRQNFPIEVVRCFILLTLLDIIRRDHLISEVINVRSERFFKILISLADQSEKFWKFVDSL